MYGMASAPLGWIEFNVLLTFAAPLRSLLSHRIALDGPDDEAASSSSDTDGRDLVNAHMPNLDIAGLKLRRPLFRTACLPARSRQSVIREFCSLAVVSGGKKMYKAT